MQSYSASNANERDRIKQVFETHYAETFNEMCEFVPVIDNNQPKLISVNWISATVFVLRCTTVGYVFLTQSEYEHRCANGPFENALTRETKRVKDFTTTNSHFGLVQYSSV